MPLKLILNLSRPYRDREEEAKSDSDDEIDLGPGVAETFPIAWERAQQRAEKGSLSRELFPRSAKSRMKGPKNLCEYFNLRIFETLQCTELGELVLVLPSSGVLTLSIFRRCRFAGRCRL